MKSATPKGSSPAKKAAPGPAQPGDDPFKTWDDYFANTKFETPARAEAFLFQTVAELLRAKKFDHTEAAVKGFLRHRAKDGQPWMYEMLVKCIESRKGTDSESKKKNEQEVKQAIGFAAYLSKRTKNPNDLVRIADMMVIREFYGPVGDPGYQTNIGELVDMAAEKIPANAVPPMMSINLATHEKDPKRMADAADCLLALGWPGIDDQTRRDVKEQVKKLTDALRTDGRTEDADTLMTRLAESETRDLYIRLTWKGEADIDIAVAEPLGATANFQNCRTVFGGAIIKNGYGKHPEEVYVCPRAFSGDYVITVDKIVDYDEKKPVLEANLEVILHEGTAEEKRETYKIDLAKPQPIAIKLTDGRRKTVLPFIAPTRRPAPPEKPKETAKGATKAAAPPALRGAPFR